MYCLTYLNILHKIVLSSRFGPSYINKLFFFHKTLILWTTTTFYAFFYIYLTSIWSYLPNTLDRNSINKKTLFLRLLYL